MPIHPPTAEQLQLLPLRAIVAYASRSARRPAKVLLDGVVAEEVDTLLGVADRFVVCRDSQPSDVLAALGAASDVARAASSLPRESVDAWLAAAAARSVAMTMYSVVQWMLRLKPACACASKAASYAVGAAEAADILEEPAATAARQAALRDYECFVKAFGIHDNVILGEPFDPSEIAGIQ